MTWEEVVSQLRELAKESEDFTNRLQTLASQIQRMCRDADRITDMCICEHKRMFHSETARCNAPECTCVEYRPKEKK